MPKYDRERRVVAILGSTERAIKVMQMDSATSWWAVSLTQDSKATINCKFLQTSVLLIIYLFHVFQLRKVLSSAAVKALEDAKLAEVLSKEDQKRTRPPPEDRGTLTGRPP